jgi:NAD(P)H-dependent flavin oxidoreductase YrpB (nitropropane dioxygenase family)
MTFEQMVQAIDEIQAATEANFGVNMRTDALDIDKRVDHVIKAKVPVASFAQAPGEKIVKNSKDAGIVGDADHRRSRHAEKVAAWGVDASSRKGQEGGGHTVSCRPTDPGAAGARRGRHPGASRRAASSTAAVSPANLASARRA